MFTHRSWHVAAALDNDRMLIHGGLSAAGPGQEETSLCDTWMYCAGTKKFIRLADMFENRLWHTICFDDVCGGICIAVCASA